MNNPLSNEQDQAQVQSIELIAGRHPNGEIVAERVLVLPQEDDSFLLVQSPVFVRGIARGDMIQPMPEPKGAFQLLRHGGNLCIRVYSQTAITDIEQALTAPFEKLGGQCEVSTNTTLVYSIHVSCGFKAIEELLNKIVGQYADSGWLYGNVYDPENGEPLNWWQPHLEDEQ